MIHPDKLETGDWVCYRAAGEHGRHDTVYDYGVVADAHFTPHIVQLESRVMIRIEDITDVRRRPITDEETMVAVGAYTEKTTKGMDDQSQQIVREVLMKFARWFIKAVQHE